MQQERKQILIVDDTEIDRLILKKILNLEFDILEADSGRKALEYITKEHKNPDVILLDISMPQIDGFAVLHYMRDKNIHIPVFLVTAEPTKENVVKAANYHVADFIRKPFDKDEILRRIRSKLGIK